MTDVQHGTAPAHPYQNLPARAFWRSGVRDQQPETVEDLYRRRFAIAPTDRIATAGSCFAQHIARRLRSRGYTVVDMEPPPRGLNAEVQARFGYGIYAARFGNIYTARQLLQLIQESRGKFEPAEIAWERDGRWYDALRPGVEPEGLDSREEVLALRAQHLRHVRTMLNRTDILVFTLGLTEAWRHVETGTVYPMAPGTIAGRYDPAVHEFHNFTYEEILRDLQQVHSILKRINPAFRLLLTVSPVPLAATASNAHVLPATIRSKSVLRAVAAAMQERHEDVDYFPAYEIIASSFSEGRFYDADRRNVTPAGVDAVMRVFFEQHPPLAPAPVRERPDPESLACEEAMLEAFAR
jgi:hypothetical protein